jgi:hypothetical protein
MVRAVLLRAVLLRAVLLRAVLLRAVLQACVRWVVMVPVLRVLVYLPVLETRMSKAVSSGETSVSRPKNVTWKLY